MFECQRCSVTYRRPYLLNSLREALAHVFAVHSHRAIDALMAQPGLFAEMFLLTTLDDSKREKS